MRGPALAGHATAVALALACTAGIQEQVRDESRFGPVRIYADSAPAAGLVYLFSDAAGWNPALATAARRIAASGALAVGVDLPSYLRGLRASDDGCHYVVSEIEDLSHRLQREHGFPGYRSPILAGIGAGGTLAYAALAQSPAATLGGSISVDSAPDLATRVPLCEGAPAHADPTGGYRYDAKPALPGFWWASPRRSLPAPLADVAQEAPAVAMTAGPESRLADLVLAALAREGAAQSELRDLPLVELPVQHPASQLAVIYSGDGGWRDLDKDIAEVLVRDGTPVVGVDSLRYFWREKTPERVATDLERILRHYRAEWDAPRVLLVGYSFGAGILPFAVHRLPPDLRDAVVQISLLGLVARAPFEISVRGWLGAHGDGLPVLPELRALDLRRVQCIYGEEEEDTLCTVAELAEAERIRTPGGHHFDGDYQRLARDVLSGAKRRSSGG